VSLERYTATVDYVNRMLANYYAYHAGMRAVGG